jgi:hypothetical protein
VGVYVAFGTTKQCNNGNSIEQEADVWIHRLKHAAADPATLTQETIIDNLDAVERGRLARIRNIGIAVRP